MRALPAILIVVAIVALAVLVAERPGDVSIVWQGWRIDTSVGVLLLAIAIGAGLAMVAFTVLRRLAGGPAMFFRRRRERRRRDGYHALTQGMVAVAAGDAEEAQRFARKADVLLAEPPLTLLLSAQAAQLNGDEDAARRYFMAMLARPETEFLGLRGLLTQAVRAGDDATALELAERAHRLRPRTPWVLTSLFTLQTRKGNWASAQATLAEAVKRRALPGPEGERHRLALLLGRGLDAEKEGDVELALGFYAKASSIDASFAPIAERRALLLKDTAKPAKAARVIEAAWRTAPHPRLAAAYGDLFPQETVIARLQRMERLAAINPGHPESRLALAGAATRAQLWGEARRHLEPLAERPTPRVCALMAELDERERNDLAGARAWLARAAHATPDPVYVCSNCNGESEAWQPHCPHCASFDSLVWRIPTRTVAPMLGAASGNMAMTGADPALIGAPTAIGQPAPPSGVSLAGR